MSIPSTLIAGFIGLDSCGDMVASDSEIIVAHRSRSAQGRVHFITTLHTGESHIVLAFSPSPQRTNHPSDGTLWSFCTTLLVAIIPLTVHPSHRCAVAHANRLTLDSLLARPCVHGAGPPRCRVANRPFS